MQQAQPLTLVTSDHASIEAARQAQQAERRAVEQATGVKIRDDGSIATPPVVIHCIVPGCPYFVEAPWGTAERQWARHITSAHPQAPATKEIS